MSLPAVWTHLLESPLGPLGAVFDGRGGLCRLGFMPREEAAWPEGASWNGDRSFRYLLRQLEAYFRGDCRTFNVPLTLEGSAFQLRVWRMLADIPFGETLSYRELALRLGCRAGQGRGAGGGRQPRGDPRALPPRAGERRRPARLRLGPGAEAGAAGAGARGAPARYGRGGTWRGPR